MDEVLTILERDNTLESGKHAALLCAGQCIVASHRMLKSSCVHLFWGFKGRNLGMRKAAALS